MGSASRRWPASPNRRSLKALKEEITRRWGVIDLLDVLDVLKDVAHVTGFTTEFTSVVSRTVTDAEVLQRRLLLCLYGLRHQRRDQARRRRPGGVLHQHAQKFAALLDDTHVGDAGLVAGGGVLQVRDDLPHSLEGGGDAALPNSGAGMSTRQRSGLEQFLDMAVWFDTCHSHLSC